MEPKEPSRREETRRTRETQTVYQGGNDDNHEHSRGHEEVLPDNLTSLSEESGPLAMKLETPWNASNRDGLQEEATREVSLQAGHPPIQLQSSDNDVTRMLQGYDNTKRCTRSPDRPSSDSTTQCPLEGNEAERSQVTRSNPLSTSLPLSALSSGQIYPMSTSQADPYSEHKTPITSSQQTANTIPKLLDTIAVTSGHQPTPHSHIQPPDVSRAGPQSQTNSDASPMITELSEASGTKPEQRVDIPLSGALGSEQSSSCDVSSRHRQLPEARRTSQEESTGSDASPPVITPSDRSGTQHPTTSDATLTCVQSPQASERTDQPSGSDDSPIHGSSSETSVSPPPEQRGTDASQEPMSLTTSEEDPSPTKLEAVPSEESTTIRTQGGCTADIGILLRHTGDDPEVIGHKEQILYELGPQKSHDRMKTIYGLLHCCCPEMDQWKRDKLLESESCKTHETPVHNVIRELNHNGVTVGQAVQYFMQEHSMRRDIVRLIYKIHTCDFCATLESKKSESST